MSILESLILAIVEGITEFLPISSTGHLVLTSKIIGLIQTEFVKSFEISIQLGAILAIVVLYWKKFISDTKLLKNLLIAFIPASIIGFFFYSFIKESLIGNYSVTLLSLFLGGIILIFIEKFLKKSKEKTNNPGNLSFLQSFLIGVFQSVSVIPGVSRAAATIIGGLTVGLNRAAATEFSFLLAVPTMLAATGFDLYKSSSSFEAPQFSILGVGFFFSFLTALLAVKFLISFVKRHDFKIFGVYRIILAVLYWVLLMN